LLDAHKKIEAMNYAIADYEQTIQKFRDHTERLKDKFEEVQKRLAEETQDRSLQTATESIDYKVRFAETKAHARAIEMELRRLEVVQANQHVAYVCAFLPDAFQARGGDHEAVKMLLLVPRIIAKCDILAAQLREKFPAPEYITRALVLKTHTIEQYTYGCMMLFLLYTLHALLQQYITALNSCSVDLYQKCATLFTEMIAQEKLIDFYIDLLRKDQLDENVPLDKLEKAVTYFESLYSVHLSSERVSGSQFMADRLKVMSVSCYAILACLKAIKSLTKDNKDELLALLNDAVTATEDIQQVLKKIKRRVPLEKNSPVVLDLSTDTQEEVLECCHKLGRVLRVFLSLQKAAIQSTILQGEHNEEISLDKLKELTHEATDHVYGKDDNGPECLRLSLKGVLDTLTALNDKVQEGSMERDSSSIIKMTSPVQICSQTAKEKAKDMEQMRVRIEQQQSDIQELRKTVKAKTEEVREMVLRRDMAEKRVDLVCRDVEEQRDRLQRQLDELQIQMNKNEKEHNETTEMLESDISQLEKERRELKEQIKLFQRKGDGAGARSEVRLSPAHSHSPVAVQSSGVVHSAGFTPVADGVVNGLRDQVAALTRALQVERNSRFHQMADEISESANRLRALDVPKNPSWLLRTTNSREDSLPQEQLQIRQRICELTRKIHDVKAGYLATLAEQSTITPLGSKDSSVALTQHTCREVRLARLKEQTFTLQNEAHLDTDATLIGRVSVPFAQEKTESTFVDYPSIQRIHRTILA
ncbi:dynactin subunit 1-like, partial [Tropilaelaps mercedesae]